MTLKQKFKELHPEMDADKAIADYCPEDFGLERGISFDECDEMDCTSCWNREYKEEKDD